jgi:hypothetical protein
VNPAHLPPTARNRHFAAAAATVLLAAAFVEVARMVANRPWGELPPAASHVAGGMLAVLWITAAATLLLRDRARAAAKTAFVLAVVAPVAMFAHGLITGAIYARIGLLYVPLAAALAMLVKGAFGGGELWRLRRRHRLDADPGLAASARHAAGDQRATP